MEKECLNMSSCPQWRVNEELQGNRSLQDIRPQRVLYSVFLCSGSSQIHLIWSCCRSFPLTCVPHIKASSDRRPLVGIMIMKPRRKPDDVHVYGQSQHTYIHKGGKGQQNSGLCHEHESQVSPNPNHMVINVTMTTKVTSPEGSRNFEPDYVFLLLMSVLHDREPNCYIWEQNAVKTYSICF